MEKNITVRLTARLFAEEKCYGPGVEQLLKAVEKHRSLRAAAASMSMAYSKAWSIIRAAEQGFGCKLLHSTIGGSGGGGAELTDEARQIMAAYETYCARLNEYGQALFGELFPFCARENHIDSTRKERSNGAMLHQQGGSITGWTQRAATLAMTEIRIRIGHE